MKLVLDSALAYPQLSNSSSARRIADPEVSPEPAHIRKLAVRYSKDEANQRIYAQVVDRESGDLIREIPTGEMRRLSERVGILLDTLA